MDHTSSRRFIKPFGWGERDTHYRIDKDSQAYEFLRSKFSLETITLEPTSFDLAKLEISPSRMPVEIVQALVQLLGDNAVATDAKTRKGFCVGRSYRDLMNLRSMRLQTAPDAVLAITNAEKLTPLLRLCANLGIALVPFGGGTSVVGGLDPERGQHPYCAAIDMTALNRIVHFDEISHLVTVECGVYGLDLEEFLNAKGCTLGHFPQSFEYTTVGGWIAARSSGQNSILYGNIDKLVVAVTMVTPQGVIHSHLAPNHACGPDLKQVMIGSEGAFGVISSCTLRVAQLPETRRYLVLMFKDFATAATAARTIAQSEARPAMVRVSDGDESESMLRFSPHPHRWKDWIKGIALRNWERSGYHEGSFSLVTLGFEGSYAATQFSESLVIRSLERFSYKNLGERPGKKWLRERFFLPYARDFFIDQGLLVDTLETATIWSNFPRLYESVKSAMAAECTRQGVKYAVFCHLSHLYACGTSLYFTIICQQRGDPFVQWSKIKTAASAAIVAAEGVISHHHGIGVDHRNYVGTQPLERKLWQEVKRVFDPANVMNPGKMLPRE